MKTKKNRNIQISEKQLENIKRKVSKEVTNKAMLLMMCAVADELHVDDETLCNCAKRAERYCNYIDSKTITMNELSKSIKESTGIDWGEF